MCGSGAAHDDYVCIAELWFVDGNGVRLKSNSLAGTYFQGAVARSLGEQPAS